MRLPDAINKLRVSSQSNEGFKVDKKIIALYQVKQGLQNRPKNDFYYVSNILLLTIYKRFYNLKNAF